MQIIPAIDLLGNKVVRLSQGVEDTATVYSDNPIEIAQSFHEAGAQWIHIVDLDGAFGRSGVNDDLIEQITAAVPIPVELGGGIRSINCIGYWLNRGITRVVIGSAAVKDPDMVEKAIRKHGNIGIVVGIDIKDNEVAIHGWTEGSGMDYLDLAKKMKTAGLARFIVTDISTDGMLTGPKLKPMVDIADNTGLAVIASGGISGLDDLTVIAEHAGHGIEGIIIGRAIYEKRLNLKEAIDRYQK
jgi:phosphoribosylformimino-5-aminoimidazole carboxamide ribotide isomerase